MLTDEYDPMAIPGHTPAEKPAKQPAPSDKAVKAAAKKVSRKAAEKAAGKGEPETQPSLVTPEESGERAVLNVAAAELRRFIERIERLEEEKATIGDDIKDVFGEAKGRGFDTKAMKTIIRLRRMDANKRIEEETILQTYMAGLGME